MPTDAQINANRNNASKSTGPKTEKGKAKVRQNALKHGGRAKTIELMPVLPHEDPKQLEERIQVWIDDWQPRNAIEGELVRRGARLSWMLERGERFESAHLAHRVRLAGQRAGPTASASAKRVKWVDDLARKLFYDYKAPSYGDPLPPWDNDPAVFVAELEETLEGCRWLLARWRDVLAWEESGAGGTDADAFRFVRLLGKHGIEAVNDRELNALFQAWDVCWRDDGRNLWEMHKSQTSGRDPAMKGSMTWRELSPRPCSEAQAVAFIRGVIDERIGRLEQRVAEFEQIAEAEAAERADRASFDPSPSFERHRRHQASLGRELLRTVDTLRRLQKGDSRTQPVAVADDPSWDKIPILSPSHEKDKENDRIGILSHELEVGPDVLLDGEGLPTGASTSTPPTQPRGEEENQGICSPRGWGGGSHSETTPQESQGLPTGASASTPPTQPPGVPCDPSWDKIPILSPSYEKHEQNDRIGILSHGREGEVHEQESATIEAKPESTQG